MIRTNMLPPRPAPGGQFVPLLLFVILIAGCGGGSSNVAVSIPPVLTEHTVSGTVLMPNGQLAQLDSSFVQRFAELAVRKVEALTGTNVGPVGSNVPVTLGLYGSDGNQVACPQCGPPAYTNDEGQYQLTLPSGTDENTCRYFVSVGDLNTETLTRAFVFSTTEAINIDFASEAVVRMIVAQAMAGTDLCSFSPGTIEATVQAIDSMPGMLTVSPSSDNMVRDINSSAVKTATAAPPVQETLGIAAATPTPTPGTPTATVQPSATPTPVTPSATPVTPAATATPTNTSLPSATPTKTSLPSATSTKMPTATPTATPTTPSATQTATATATGARPTSSATPTATPTVTPTVTPTAMWTSTPTATPTASAAVTAPHIAIGSASGARGTQVSVSITLTKNGPNIVTIAPLVFAFDPNVLTFTSCASDVAAEQMAAVSPAAGRVSVVMYSASLAVIPDGQIAHCTFTISGSVAVGPSALTFIAAGMADAAQTDYTATGTAGSVTVSAPSGPAITIGSVTGARGTSVDVPISLTKNGPQIVTIAPLVFTFDSNVLTFSSCTSDIAGEQVSALSPTAGQVSLVMESASLAVIPDGQIAHCTFTISGSAAVGPSALTFIAAGMADAAQTDYTATGTAGSVPVSAPSGPAITIGSATGARGASVDVPISLTKNGPSIVTIAPLVFTFDPNVLTFSSCASDVAFEQVAAVSPVAGRVSMVMYSAGLDVIPDGQVAHCSFTISGSAAVGPSALTFVAAGMADAAQTDYTATGTAGSVSVTAPSGPVITIGSATGAPGTSVDVPISLAKNGPNIVTIAPLVFAFDPDVLTFSSCASDIAGEQVSALSPTAGYVRLVMESAGLTVIADGQIAHCTFTINGSAAVGASALTFVAAGMADAAQTDYTASGTAGSVTVTAPSGPVITIGSASGAPGTPVNVPISLAQNGSNIVTIAPLVFTFDSTVLTFSSCTSDITGEDVSAVSPTAGYVRLVMESAGLTVIADGQIAHCTFTISGSASVGQSPLTFIAAGMADAAQNDITASGSSGSVTVQ